MSTVNSIEVRVNLRKNNNEKSDQFGRYYPSIDRRHTLSLRGLSKHISDHGSIYTRDVVEGVLTKLTQCIPELLSQGIPVKLDGLGTFVPTVQNGPIKINGVAQNGLTDAQLKDSSIQPSSLVAGIHIRFRPDGSELQNLTSRQFLAQKVSLESRYVLSGTKGEKDLIATPLETFRAPVDPGD